MYTNEIRNIIEVALKSTGYDVPTGVKIDIVPPKDSTFGDYATSIALVLAKRLGLPPLEIANTISQNIRDSELITSVNVAKPGFINFFIKKEKLLNEIMKTDGEATLEGAKIAVEYTDPNPFKEFHIGHLYSNAVGESLTRLMVHEGATVRRLCYQGDIGLHVACSVWGMTRGESEESLRKKLASLSNVPLAERVKWLGSCYAVGATANKEDPAASESIKNLNAQLFVAAQEMNERTVPGFKSIVSYSKLIKKEVIGQSLAALLYETGRAWTLSYFEEIYAKLGTSFDAYYFESEVGEYGYSLVKAHIADGIFEESNGAIIFPGEKYGLHTRVLINSLGLPTYEAKELGLNPKKFADWSFDKSIIVTANEVDEYFKVVLKAMSLITPDIASKTKHVSHGVVKFPEGKMSSRTGKILSAEALINEVKTRLSAVVAQNTNIPPEDKENTVEKLAVASIKYTFLKSGIGKDIIFDFDESLSFEGNSAPYLLYMIVRCNSLISKAIESGYYNPNISFENNNEALSNISADDLSLIRSLAKFKESAMVATERLAPHILCTYLHNLAQDFSSYYEKVNILKSEPSARGFRLFLISKVQETLTNGVHLLGFTEVKRM